jgi:hypothetical protein
MMQHYYKGLQHQYNRFPPARLENIAVSLALVRLLCGSMGGRCGEALVGSRDKWLYFAYTLLSVFALDPKQTLGAPQDLPSWASEWSRSQAARANVWHSSVSAVNEPENQAGLKRSTSAALVRQSTARRALI